VCLRVVSYGVRRNEAIEQGDTQPTCEVVVTGSSFAKNRTLGGRRRAS